LFYKVNVAGCNFAVNRSFTCAALNNSADYCIFVNTKGDKKKKEVKNRDTHILNISRLLTQEISLMKDRQNPRQAFERQSKLLRDAFRTLSKNLALSPVNEVIYYGRKTFG